MRNLDIRFGSCLYDVTVWCCTNSTQFLWERFKQFLFQIFWLLQRVAKRIIRKQRFSGPRKKTFSLSVGSKLWWKLFLELGKKERSRLTRFPIIYSLSDKGCWTVASRAFLSNFFKEWGTKFEPFTIERRSRYVTLPC